MQHANITRQFCDILLSRLHNWPKLIQIIAGPRQVGKTTGVRQIFDQWRGTKHFATADTPLPPTAEWIIQQWNIAASSGQDCLLILDEIQKIPRWSDIIKNLFDQDRQSGKIKLVLLGSASLDLNRGISESLTGRFELISVPHWSFAECKSAFNWDLEQFLKFGGYPGAAMLIGEPLRWQEYIVNSIISPVIHRDIPALQDIRKPVLFRQLFELALSYPAQEISLQKMLGQLQENGNVTTIKHYLEILSQAFLIKTLDKFSSRPISVKSSSPKIIPLCPALINALIDPGRVVSDRNWRGRIFEACIGALLLRSRGKLYYWRNGKHEVDFILLRDRQLFAIEVKSNSRKSIGGLNAFISEFDRAIPVSIDEEKGSRLLASTNIDDFIDREFTV